MTLHGTSERNGERWTVDPPVTVGFEGQARAGASEADVDGVEVLYAPGEGDDTIAAIAEGHHKEIGVPADRELAKRVRAANAEVVGPNWLLDRLVDPTCRLNGECGRTTAHRSSGT